jgi:radical SAM protein with 4Fe4S-binding SPASM domain
MAVSKPLLPSRVYLDVTNRCQLSCRHCCTSSGDRFSEELSVEEILDVVDQVHRMGVSRLVLSGGEPLMRPELPMVLERAACAALDITLLTNGLLINDEWARKLAQWRVRVKVSLDGALAGTHDYLRGPGTFDRTCNALTRLAAAGARDLTVHFTVHTMNLRELPLLPALLHSLGVRNVVVGTIKPSGRARINEQLLIPPRMVPYVQQRVRELKRHQEIAVCHIVDKGWEGFGCPAVCNKLGITADGRLTTCAFFGRELLGESIRCFPLEELWRRHLARGAVFEANVSCRSCPALARCGGGCRARALYYHGHINATDPCCCAFQEKKSMIGENRRMLEAALLDPLKALAGDGIPAATGSTPPGVSFPQGATGSDTILLQ